MALRASKKRKGDADDATIEIRDKIRSHVPDAIEELARLAVGASSEATRLSAINALLDRGYGQLKELSEGNDAAHGILVRFVTPPEKT